MPRSVTSARVDEAALEAILQPRTSLVRERAAGDGRFEAEVGPVDRYERVVEVTTRDDGSVEVRQTVDFHLSFPIFRWLMTVAYRRGLRRLGRPRHTPWWAPPDPLDQRAAATISTLAAITAVGVYPGILLTQAIEFIREDMKFSARAQSFSLAAVRADVLIAVGLVAVADRAGRRRITLASAAVGCGLTAVGGLAPNLIVLTATQIAARGCLAAAGILIGIMTAEEMPAGSRAYAVSVLAASGALGAGAALLAFPLADLDVRGWRLVFLISAAGVPLTLFFGRWLPETRRFRAHHAASRVLSHGRRFWLLGASAFLFAVFWGPAAQYMNVFLRRERGFSAARISLFTVATDIWGGIGIVAGGRLADARGRRGIAAIGIVGGVGATVIMFYAAGWPVWAWSVVGSIIGATTVPALGVYGPELFPTATRGRANGIISGLGRLGSVLGLLVLGTIVGREDRLAPIMALLALGPLLVVILVLVAYPETAHRELEDLNPEDRVDGQ